MSTYRFLLFCALLFVAACSNQPEITATSRCFYMGFTPFPWDISLVAFLTTNRQIVSYGDIVSHHLEQGVPWPEALNGEPFHPKMVEDWNGRKNMAAGRTIFLSLNPLNEGRNGMDGYRGEKDDMPLPESFQGKAFNDPAVKLAYLNYCLRAVEHFQPDYLAIGIEVNELFHNAPDRWPGFVELYQETYTALKKKHPDLAVFATVSLHNLTNTGWNDRDEQRQEIRTLIDSMDMVGISYYPFMAGQSERPIETFDWLRQFTNKPIAIAETGYPAEDIHLPSLSMTIPGTPLQQKTYFDTLLERANRDRYTFVIAFLFRDYDALWDKIKETSPEAFVVWKDCGMYDENGYARPAFDLWKKYYILEKTDSPE